MYATQPEKDKGELHDTHKRCFAKWIDKQFREGPGTVGGFEGLYGPDRIPKWSIRLLYVIVLDTSGHGQDVCQLVTVPLWAQAPGQSVLPSPDWKLT